MHGIGECREPEQNVFDAQADQPSSVLLPAIDHFAQQKIIVELDPDQRERWQRLTEPDLGAAFAQVSDGALKNPLRRSDHAIC